MLSGVIRRSARMQSRMKMYARIDVPIMMAGVRNLRGGKYDAEERGVAASAAVAVAIQKQAHG